jgi:heme-degrading monooxygenase HmoA
MLLPAKTPEPPYYAVIFTSVRTGRDEGYGETAQRMMALAATRPGFLGVESAREELGITVSYWTDLPAIAAWKAHIEHRQAQQRNKVWYQQYQVRICRVERDYHFQAFPS